MEVQGGKDNEGQNIRMWNKHKGLNQKWDVTYVKEMKPEPTKGQLNKRFGLYVERPFHIVTAMKSGRYVDVVENNIVIKTPNGFKTQIWWFDQKTKTIKSQADPNKSLSIENQGRTNNAQLWNTQYRWF